LDQSTDDHRFGHPLDLAAIPNSKRPPRHLRGQRFIRGPIPWDWLIAASGLPSTAVRVGLVLWHLAGLRNNRRFRFEYARAAELGLSRFKVYRALDHLEHVGLVKVERNRGRCHIVTILDAKQ
jgi:hypothetical protein